MTVENIHGFLLEEKKEIKEVSATLFKFRHEKSGAGLLFLEREDECKTFAIGFKTIPEDDTGVFHIIEHSVLCGSDKYPVKDPFTEVMKGSVNAYMNAFTAPDKTYYPISTKNEKDFYNLISVYMDAVLHPKLLENESIFLREGVRIEFPQGEEPRLGGVVYNEMSGAYARVEENANYITSRLLYPGGCYSFDTGGHPDCIPTLSYEKVIETYHKFYHPSNSYILLDGKINLDKTLALLDDFLKEYRRDERSFEIEMGGDPVTDLTVSYYPTEKAEEEKNKNYLFLSNRVSEYGEFFDNVATGMLVDCLADSNDAPLKKALLSTGLCDNVSLYFSETKYCSLDTEFIGVKDGRAKELISEYERICREIVDTGIPDEVLLASLNLLEFKNREADFGTTPRGMIYLSCCLDAWIYGIDPSLPLSYDKTFSFLRSRIGTDYFKNLLEKMLLPEKRVKLLMKPDKSLFAKEEAARKKACLDMLKALGEDRAREAEKSFLAWQSSADTKDDLEKIPRLSLDDLAGPPSLAPTAVGSIEGLRVLRHSIPTSGIIYAELHFDISDLTVEQLQTARLLSAVLPDLVTESGDPSVFKIRKKAALGGLYSTVEVINERGEPKCYFVVRASSLFDKRFDLADCIREYLYTPVLDDPEAIRKKLAQLVANASNHLASAGTSYSIARAAARYNRTEAMKEHISGFSFIKAIKELHLSFEKKVDTVIETMKDIRDRLFVKERATLSLTCSDDGGIAELILSYLPKGEARTKTSDVTPFPRINEGIVAATHAGFSAMASNLATANEVYCGSLATLSSILSLEILLEEIRLKGGAYDTGFIARSASGTLAAYSYCDPATERSISVFRTLKERIEGFVNRVTSLDGYVISTIGGLDGLSTPRSDGAYATLLYLSGISEEDIAQTRREVLSTTKEELLRLADVVGKAIKHSSVCIVADKESLLKMGNQLDEILEL